MSTVIRFTRVELQRRIFTIRGQQVMVDRDLAELYQVETKVLNQAVKRNTERFPERFRFQLTKKEKDELVTNCDRFKRLKHATVMPYVFINGLLRQAKFSIVLIDNYIDDSVLMQLSKRPEGVSATILTKAIPARLKQDVKKHNAQCPPIAVHSFPYSHDRFLILDGETVYHIGASLKDMGKKWFAFSRMDKKALTMMEKVEAVLKQEQTDA